jgi:prophage regulatory protein
MATMPRPLGLDGIGLPEPRGDQELSPLLLTARQAASMCGKSLRTWRTWDAAGWIPRPVRIGRSTLWRTDELRDWVAAGCPRRAEWEARK